MAHVDMLSSWGPDLAGRLSQPMCSAGRARYIVPQMPIVTAHVADFEPQPPFLFLKPDHPGALADCQTCGWLYR